MCVLDGEGAGWGGGGGGRIEKKETVREHISHQFPVIFRKS